MNMTINENTSVEQLGKLFQISLPADRTSEWANIIREVVPGSIVIQGANVSIASDIAGFAWRIRSICLDADITRERFPLIGITQEGGWISRVTDIANSPGNMALGAAGSVTSTYASYRAMAEELRSLGIDWDLAPVVDVNTEPSNPIIGVRSFGDDPKAVSAHSLAALDGLEDGGLLSCVKHFPGHGATSSDSHITLPRLDLSLEELERCDLLPYRESIRRGSDSIMISHVAFPAIEGRGRLLPATLSKKITTGLLRERLGYDGLVVTDSLSMSAVADNFPAESVPVSAIDAGADILECASPEMYMVMFHSLRSAVASGRVGGERIARSIRRFDDLRRTHAALGRRKRGTARWSRQARYSATRASLVSSVTLVGRRIRMPLLKGCEAVHSFYFSRSAMLEDRGITEGSSPLSQIFREWGFTGGRHFTAPRNISSAQAGEMSQLAAAHAGKNDFLVVFTNDALASKQTKGRRPQIDFTMQIHELMEGRVAAVGTGTPYEAELLKGIPYVCAYSFRKEALSAAVGVLAGGMAAQGRLPVKMQGVQ